MNPMPCVSLFIELYVIAFAIDAPHSFGVRDININKRNVRGIKSFTDRGLLN
jgi:hypothetical protein